MNNEMNIQTASAPASSLERMVSRPREITPDDVTKEADRNYDLGRKHAKDEMHPAIMAMEALYHASGHLRLRCEQICPEVKRFSDWQKHSEAMRMVENARMSANESSSVTGAGRKGEA